jgi:hypothetical protein
MRLFAHIVSIAGLLFLVGCGRQQTFGVEDEKKRWEADGWTYHETFGRPTEDSVVVFNASSDTAQQTSAFARTDGTLTNRVYMQTNSIYLVVTMERTNGDQFALVFTKPKP